MREPNWKKMYIALLGGVDDTLAALDKLPLIPDNVLLYNLLTDAIEAAETIYCTDDPDEDEDLLDLPMDVPVDDPETD